MVTDLALVHDFSGDCWRNVGDNVQLRLADPAMVHNNAASDTLTLLSDSSLGPSARDRHTWAVVDRRSLSSVVRFQT